MLLSPKLENRTTNTFVNYFKIFFSSKVLIERKTEKFTRRIVKKILTLLDCEKLITFDRTKYVGVAGIQLINIQLFKVLLLYLHVIITNNF